MTTGGLSAALRCLFVLVRGPLVRSELLAEAVPPAHHRSVDLADTQT